MKWSRNPKLEKLLNAIENSLLDMGLQEVTHYHDTFRWQTYPDYNIVEYGNLLVYFDDIRQLYRQAGYRWAETATDMQLWRSYKRAVGYVAHELIRDARSK